MQDNYTPPPETPQVQPQQEMPHVTDPSQMTQQPGYGQSVFQQPAPSQRPQTGEDAVTLGDWMVTMLLMCLPLVNIILLFVWSFGGDTKPSKENWAKATLIWMAIGILINIILMVAFWGAFAAGVSEFGNM